MIEPPHLHKWHIEALAIEGDQRVGTGHRLTHRSQQATLVGEAGQHELPGVEPSPLEAPESNHERHRARPTAKPRGLKVETDQAVYRFQPGPGRRGAARQGLQSGLGDLPRRLSQLLAVETLQLGTIKPSPHHCTRPKGARLETGAYSRRKHFEVNHHRGRP